MSITYYQPEHPLLKPLIAGIYLLQRDAGEAGEQYLAFPGIHHFVTIHHSAVYDLSAGRVSVTYREHSPPSALLVASFDNPRIWSYEGPSQEWNICFQPLALHYFAGNGQLPLRSGVTELNPSGGLDGHLQNLYRSTDISCQLRAIENYWLPRLQEFRHPFLPQLLQELLGHPAAPLNFGELAARFNVSRTTLHAEFKRYIGTSPARFEKIARFRQALSIYRATKEADSLTSISLKADYFDQSHMIRDFRSLTGRTPKDFYKKVARFPGGGISWIFN